MGLLGLVTLCFVVAAMKLGLPWREAAGGLERWLRRHVIDRIPGAGSRA